MKTDERLEKEDLNLRLPDEGGLNWSILKNPRAALAGASILLVGFLLLSAIGGGNKEATPPGEAEAQPQESPGGAAPLEAPVAQRNDALNQALAAVSAQNDAILCVRQRAILAEAEAERLENGTPIEETVLNKLSNRIQATKREVTERPELSGSPEDIDKARALSGDLTALLLLSQRLYTEEALPLCRVSLAESYAEAEKFWNDATIAARLNQIEP